MRANDKAMPRRLIFENRQLPNSSRMANGHRLESGVERRRPRWHRRVKDRPQDRRWKNCKTVMRCRQHRANRRRNGRKNKTVLRCCKRREPAGRRKPRSSRRRNTTTGAGQQTKKRPCSPGQSLKTTLDAAPFTGAIVATESPVISPSGFGRDGRPDRHWCCGARQRRRPLEKRPCDKTEQPMEQKVPAERRVGCIATAEQ